MVLQLESFPVDYIQALPSMSNSIKTVAASSLTNIHCPICGEAEAKFAFEKKGRSFFDCKGCSLRMQSPLPTLEELSQYYESEFQQGMYRDFTDAEDMKRLTAQYRLKKLQRLQIADGPWLDVGCANGVFVEAALQVGKDARGVELSATAVEQAVRKGLPVVRAEVEDLPPNPKFACITAFDVIEHVLKPDAFLNEIARRLLPGGICVLTLPNLNSVFARAMGKNWWFYIPEEHLHYFSSKTMRSLAKKIGLDVLHIGQVSKPLTFDYGLTQFKVFNPIIYKCLNMVCKFLPAGARSRVIPFAIGEMIVVLRSTVAASMEPGQKDWLPGDADPEKRTSLSNNELESASTYRLDAPSSIRPRSEIDQVQKDGRVEV